MESTTWKCLRTTLVRVSVRVRHFPYEFSYEVPTFSLFPSSPSSEVLVPRRVLSVITAEATAVRSAIDDLRWYALQ